jgi:hypothetical protein
MITKKAKEYVDGLWSMNRWNYSVIISADFIISTSYLDRLINEITSITGAQTVFALSTSGRSKGNYIYALINGENITRFQLTSLSKFKNHDIINVKRIKSKNEIYGLLKHLMYKNSYHNIVVKQT